MRSSTGLYLWTLLMLICAKWPVSQGFDHCLKSLLLRSGDLHSQAFLLSEPLLPVAAAYVSSSGVPHAACLSRGKSRAHSSAVRACPDPLFGGPYMQHRISWADGPHELHSPGRENLGQRSRGAGGHRQISGSMNSPQRPVSRLICLWNRDASARGPLPVGVRARALWELMQNLG